MTGGCLTSPFLLGWLGVFALHVIVSGTSANSIIDCTGITLVTDFVARCFPVCGACREASACASGPPAETMEKPSRSKDWAPNTLKTVRLKCGCTGIPWPIVKLMGTKEQVICDRHGLTVILKDRKRNKRKEQIEGQEEMVPF
jgi:hypothetical protein